MTEIAMTVEELRGDVVSGLVEQGFKRADCELVSRECLNTGSFDEFYREALDRISTRRRNGHSVVQAVAPARKAAPARVAAVEPMSCANPACGKKLRSSNRDPLGRCSSCRICRWTPQIAAAASSQPAPVKAAEKRIFCAMCGDTGSQNGYRCPQPGCRKANGLPPFNSEGLGVAWSPEVLRARLSRASEDWPARAPSAAEAPAQPVPVPLGEYVDLARAVTEAVNLPAYAKPRGALLAVSLDTFRAKFTRTVGTKDEWTAALLRDLMAAPLGLYEIVVPAGRSVDSLRMRLKRAFRGTAADVATFTTRADKRLLGVRKEARAGEPDVITGAAGGLADAARGRA